jgi:hypothetical protein
MDEGGGKDTEHLGPAASTGYLPTVFGEPVAPLQEQPGPAEGLPSVGGNGGLEDFEHGDAFVSGQPGGGHYGGHVAVHAGSHLIAGLAPYLQGLGHDPGLLSSANSLTPGAMPLRI